MLMAMIDRESLYPRHTDRLLRQASYLRHQDGGLLRGELRGTSPRGSTHIVRLMSPKYVSLYIKGQKNNDRDAGVVRGDGYEADYAFRRIEVRRVTPHADTPRGPRPACWRATSLMDQIRQPALRGSHVIP
jgi:hypothetical protein